jgi:hypothetical protein
MTPASLQHRAAQPPDTTLRIPVAKDDLQKEARVDASPIDVIVSGTVAESCHTSLKGRAIPIDGCLQDLPVEAKTPLKLPR